MQKKSSKWLLGLFPMFLLISAPLQAFGQTTPTFSSDVRVVNVLATVRDKKGQIVSNLTKDDLKLTEDGHPQVIKYFTRETDLPLSLGLLVDTSMSQRGVLEQERRASFSFLENVMREDKDLAFVIHFDVEVELLQDLTNSRKKLEAALEQVEIPEFRPGRGRGSPGGGSQGGGGRGGSGIGTVLYDSIYLATDEVMKPQSGRKAIILLTDGEDHGSKLSLTSAIEAAQRSDTLVYSILFADKEPFGNFGGFGGGMGGRGRRGGGGGPRPQQQERPNGKKVLQQLSRETGGRYFEVSKKLSIQEIYAQIQEELRNQYSLGYTPEVSEPGYHTISLTSNRTDLIIQTREGYYRAE